MKTRLILGALFMIIAGAPAKAAVIYSTLGPGNSFDASTGWTITIDPYQAIGAPFTPGSAATLSEVDIALYADPNGYVVSVRSDSGGLPGVAIESWSTNGGGLVSLLSISNPLLAAGTQYWVTTEPNPGTTGAWNLNDQGLSGPQAADYGSGWEPFNNTVPAFRVESAVVPEPGTILLGAAGLLALAVARRRTGRSAR